MSRDEPKLEVFEENDFVFVQFSAPCKDKVEMVMTCTSGSTIGKKQKEAWVMGDAFLLCPRNAAFMRQGLM